jgi:hypothetical protein
VTLEYLISICINTSCYFIPTAFQNAPVVLQVEAKVLNSEAKESREILFALAPKLSEIEDGARAVSSSLPADCYKDFSGFQWSQTAIRKEDFQDAFVPLVIMALVNIFWDMYYTVLALFTLLVPWRFYQMVLALLQTDARRYYDVVKHIMALKFEGDRYLNEFRSNYIPLLNEHAKNLIMTDARYEERKMNLRFTGIQFAKLEELELFTLRRYLALYSRVASRVKKLRVYDEGIDSIAESVESLREVHMSHVNNWALRYALLSDSLRHKLPSDVTDASVEVIRRVDREVNEKEVQIEDKISSIVASMKKDSDVSSGPAFKNLFTRPLDDSRFIVKDRARVAFHDLWVVVLFFFMILSVSPLPGFIADMWKHRNSPAHSFREMIEFHLQKSTQTKSKLLKLIFLSIIICLFFVGLPAYMEALPRCKSLDECIDLAKETIR